MVDGLTFVLSALPFWDLENLKLSTPSHKTASVNTYILQDHRIRPVQAGEAVTHRGTEKYCGRLAGHDMALSRVSIPPCSYLKSVDVYMILLFCVVRPFASSQ